MYNLPDSGEDVVRADGCGRFMAASKVLGEETVSGANGGGNDGTEGRQSGK